jgi:hypothetical protein
MSDTQILARMKVDSFVGRCIGAFFSLKTMRSLNILIDSAT